MKTDREIAAEATQEAYDGRTPAVAVEACEKAIALARQYGALPAPAAPLTFVEQAAIAAMQGMIASNGGWGDAENVAGNAARFAKELEAALKKGGAA